MQLGKVRPFYFNNKFFNYFTYYDEYSRYLNKTKKVKSIKSLKATNTECKMSSSYYDQLIIEIGAGVGWHAVTYAGSHSNDFIIAIERTKNKFKSFQQRIINHKSLQNITAINEDATDWLPKHFFFDSNCNHPIISHPIDKFFLLYPNPYPKESQANKRWHLSSFMHLILISLSETGSIEMATNELFYFKEALNYFRNYWRLNTDVTYIKKHSDTNLQFNEQEEIICETFRPRTHFEKKYLHRGETCYNLVISK